jgi:hypothetical protein
VPIWSDADGVNIVKVEEYFAKFPNKMAFNIVKGQFAFPFNSYPKRRAEQNAIVNDGSFSLGQVITDRNSQPYQFYPQ